MSPGPTPPGGPTGPTGPTPPTGQTLAEYIAEDVDTEDCPECGSSAPEDERIGGVYHCLVCETRFLGDEVEAG